MHCIVANARELQSNRSGGIITNHGQKGHVITQLSSHCILIFIAHHGRISFCFGSVQFSLVWLCISIPAICFSAFLFLFFQEIHCMVIHLLLCFANGNHNIICEKSETVVYVIYALVRQKGAKFW